MEINGIKNLLFMAPLAGVTDLAYRTILSHYGADIVFSEMVSAKAICYDNKKTMDLLITDKEKENMAVQLFGSEPDIIYKAIKIIDNDDFLFYNLNAGCPVPKVVNNGEGSALLKNPKLLGDIVKKMSDAVSELASARAKDVEEVSAFDGKTVDEQGLSLGKNKKKLVTVKIRSGFTEDDKNAVEIGKICEANGADMLIIHGRTREKYYSGEVDYKPIADLKRAVKIPVIGNGDIFDAKSAKKMYDETGVDGLMIARGAMGNPFIFREIKTYQETGEILPKPTIEELCDVIRWHRDLIVKYKGEYIGYRELRKHLSYYVKGHKNASKIRGEMNYLSSAEDLEKVLEKLSAMKS